MRVILDTNVIVSGLNFPGHGAPCSQLGAQRNGLGCTCLLNILEEVAGVLVHKFGWTAERSSQSLGALRNAAIIIEPQRLPEVIERDHADNRNP